MYQNYDKTLIEEFRSRLQSDSEQITLHIDNELQQINQQLKLLALDNSVRVTLMLNVDTQLKERLDAHHDTYGGTVHYIGKHSDNSIITSSRSTPFIDLVDQFNDIENRNGQLFQDQDGKTYVGFTATVKRNEKTLGIAGTISRLHLSDTLPSSDPGNIPRIFIKKKNGEFLDLSNTVVLKAHQNKAEQPLQADLQYISSHNLSGYLNQLHRYPNLYYFAPDTKLKSALDNGFTTAILLSVICIAVGVIVGMILGRSISRPLSLLSQATEKIADGQPNLPVIHHSRILELHDFSSSLLKIIHTLKEDEERIKLQANYDSLTGLPNRNLFMDRLSRSIESAERQKSRLALMFIDLDQFKSVNDTMGHQAGDNLLQQTAQRLQNSIRKSDTVARLGGDEFTVLMPDINEISHIESIINNLLSVLSAQYTLQDYEVFVTASIGLTVFPDDGTTADVLLSNADSAMYRAKEKGRNNAQFFTLEMNLNAMRRRQLETELRKAIEKDQLKVLFQPIYQTSAEKICGAEALLRWQSETQGEISPVEFIPLAEETGLILPIGEWVLKQACEKAATWNKQLDKPIYIAVNLSSRQFQRTDVFGLVARVLTETQLEPNNLTLEITESLLLEDDEDTLNTLHRFREMGINIAIDDFGTGYSSLSYLKRFPVNIIKIDRSFTSDIPDDESDTALVQSILSIGDTLGMKTIAEGVETAEQYEFLKVLNCDMVQGFYMSRPIPAEKFEKLLFNNPVTIVDAE